MSEIKYTAGQMQAVRDALAETLGGDAYDCTRVWSAWGVGTMSQDDFVPINEDDDRLHELTIAALDASGVAELLEALRLCYDHCRLYYSEVERNNVGEAVRAAIANATGSQP
jgi:hypothetical protein